MNLQKDLFDVMRDEDERGSAAPRAQPLEEGDKVFTRDGIETMLNRRATAVAYDGTHFAVTLDDGTRLVADGFLVAVGRAPAIPPGTSAMYGSALAAPLGGTLSKASHEHSASREMRSS